MVEYSKKADKRVAILVGLKRMNDIDLISDPRVFNETGFHVKDHAKVMRIAEIISDLYDGFEYHESPEFQESVSGKSEAFVAMKTKLFTTPTKRKETKLQFSRKLENLPATKSEVDKLVPAENQSLLEELCTLIGDLN